MNRESPKILIVTGKSLQKRIMDYAITAAKRLDLEIVLLFTNNKSDWHNEEQRQLAIESFKLAIKDEAAEFSALAWEQGITFNTIVDVNDRTAAIAHAQKQDPGIRFLLTDSVHYENNATIVKQHPKLTVLQSPDKG